MNANDQLRDYNCSDSYYRHSFGMVYTDGIHALCEQFKCWWFLDAIASYQPELKQEEFQVWSLGKNDDDCAIVLCTDGNNNILKSQNIPFTDFPAKEATVWVEFGTALLPSKR